MSNDLGKDWWFNSDPSRRGPGSKLRQTPVSRKESDKAFLDVQKYPCLIICGMRSQIVEHPWLILLGYTHWSGKPSQVWAHKQLVINLQQIGWINVDLPSCHCWLLPPVITHFFTSIIHEELTWLASSSATSNHFYWFLTTCEPFY